MPEHRTRLELMFEVSRTVAFGIGKDIDDGDLPVAVVAGKQEYWQRLPFEVIPEDVDDLTTDQAFVVLALEWGGLAHDNPSPT